MPGKSQNFKLLPPSQKTAHVCSKVVVAIEAEYQKTIFDLFDLNLYQKFRLQFLNGIS